MPEAPGPPAFVHAVPGDHKVKVSWGPAVMHGTGFKNYVVQLSHPGSPPTSAGGLHYVDPSTFSLTIDGLNNGSHYFATVWARDLDGIDGVGGNSTVFTPEPYTVPTAPRNVKATAGDKSALISWSKPSSNGGAPITGYLIKTMKGTTNAFVKQVHVDAKTFSHTVVKLTNDADYYFLVYAQNKAGNSPAASSLDVIPGQAPPVVAVRIKGLSPAKQANTRPGQSLSDAPKVVASGENLSQMWGVDARHKLDWLLYTDTTWTTVVGNGGPILTSDVSTSNVTVSSPVAPAGASIDSNGLIGPWRLRATYVPDAATPNTTAYAHSPAFYTTAVGTVIVGTVSPNPVHDGDTVTLTGPGMGNCTEVICDIGGNELVAAATTVDANTITFVLPTFGYQLSASGTLQGRYTLNGHVLVTDPYSVNYDPLGDFDTGGDVYTPPVAADIAGGDMGYPLLVKRWTFYCPGTGESYTVPRNPDDMTSPFPERNITTKHTTAVNGQVLLIEGAPQVANWQFSGTVADARHYEQLRHWVNDINQRVQITDHYGRVIECVLVSFAPKPRRDIRRLWSHTYEIKAIVIKVGIPTEVPA